MIAGDSVSLTLELRLDNGKLVKAFHDDPAELDRQNQQIQLSQEQDRSRRRRLTVLTAVCVLLPPLWPVAFGLSVYLLFPQTAARIGLVAGVVLLLGGLALAVALALVTLGLLQLLF
jgi:hypothetical protein